MEDDNKQHSFFLRKLAVERKDFFTFYNYIVIIIVVSLFPWEICKDVYMFASTSILSCKS